ncbi:hypothetical protein ACN6AT_37775 (plasmid) [Streptomyces sp. JL4002]|uniref:hypothetical protein n=1 Tax=Streptomyces sp. JL4002 TaxID=3404781 RepID=UPI003B27D79A
MQISMARSAAPSGPQAGIYDDMERDDNRRGFERDETDPNMALGQLLRRIAREHDRRIPAGCRARRTLAEMAPDYKRQPILRIDSAPVAEATR